MPVRQLAQLLAPLAASVQKLPASVECLEESKVDFYLEQLPDKLPQVGKIDLDNVAAALHVGNAQNPRANTLDSRMLAAFHRPTKRTACRLDQRSLL